jgi:hypothetical protein
MGDLLHFAGWRGLHRSASARKLIVAKTDNGLILKDSLINAFQVFHGG